VRIAVNPRDALLTGWLDAAEDTEVSVTLNGVGCVALALPRRYPGGRRHPPLALQDVRKIARGFAVRSPARI